jgi:hypothetical protein
MVPGDWVSSVQYAGAPYLQLARDNLSVASPKFFLTSAINKNSNKYY